MSANVQRRASGNQTRATILTAIQTLYKEQGRPPTMREIRDLSGASMGSISHNLPILERDGLIRRLGGTRGIKPIERVAS